MKTKKKKYKKKVLNIIKNLILHAYEQRQLVK